MEPYPSYMAAHMAQQLTTLATSHPPSHGLYKPPSPRQFHHLLSHNEVLPKWFFSWPNPLLASWSSWCPNGGGKTAINSSHGELKA